MRKRVQRTISMLLVLVNILGLMPINAFSTDVETSAGAQPAIVTEAPAEAQPGRHPPTIRLPLRSRKRLLSRLPLRNRPPRRSRP